MASEMDSVVFGRVLYQIWTEMCQKKQHYWKYQQVVVMMRKKFGTDWSFLPVEKDSRYFQKNHH